MSTEYSELKSPWSSIEVEIAHHIRLHIWTYGKKSGELVFGPEDELSVRDALLGFQGETVAVISARESGPVLIHLKPSRTDIVISEYGGVKSLKNMVENYPHDDNFGLNPIPKSDKGWFK